MNNDNSEILPTLRLEDIDSLNTTDGLSKDLLGGLWNLTNDDSMTHTGMTPLLDSKLPTLIQTLSIGSSSGNESGGDKIVTNKINMKRIITQSVYGKTGQFIKLIHSGFGIKLKPTTPSDRVALEYNIANSVLNVDRKLSGDVHTSVYYHINEIIMKYVISKIEYTTLKISKHENIDKYIRVKDLDLLRVAILDDIYPDGYSNFKYICNIIIPSSDAETPDRVCANLSDPHKIKISNMIYINDDFTDDEVAFISNTVKSSVSINDVTKYQAGLSYNKPETITIDDLTYTLSDGVVRDYLDKSREWVRSEVLSSPSYEDDMIDVLVDIVKAAEIGKYYYTIVKIETDQYVSDGTSPLDAEDVRILSANQIVKEKLILGSKAMLDNSAYVVGAPNYICPSCKAKNPDHNVDEIYPINVLDFFIFLV